MDRSMNYIKMCSRAERIQRFFKPNDDNICYKIEGGFIYGQPPFNFISHETPGRIKLSTYDGKQDGYYVSVIWIPRQSQLQKMLREYYNNKFDCALNDSAFVFIIATDFAGWLTKENSYQKSEFSVYPLNVFETMEQLWLAFVMHNLYNEKWDGDKWVTTDNTNHSS